MTKSKGKVLIVEDDPRAAARLKDFISNSSDFEFVGTYGRAKDFLRAMENLSDELCILDLGLPDGDGIELIKTIRRELPALRIVVYTVFEDESTIIRAMAAGANGYILKDTPRELLLAELNVVRLGGSTMTPRVAERILDISPPAAQESSLTGREHEILNLIALGFKYAEIAGELDISLHTVRRHIEKVYRKLDVNSRHEAVREAERRGLT